MSDVFANLVRISMMANWLILAVMLLRFLLKKAPRWITCVLWARSEEHTSELQSR